MTEDQILGKTSMDADWHAIHEDGSPFPGETHPAMVALGTGQSVTNVIMGVYRPATKDRVWILIDAVVQRVFDPFFTTRDVGAGTGLGLSICHSLVTRLGGHIKLNSEPDRGSTFRVFLMPAHKQP